MDNTSLFDSISTINGVKLEITLDENFKKSLNSFRGLTSEPRILNGITYPSVYLTDSDYGGLTIQFGKGQELRLIMNLEYYYVYGFFLDDSKVYAFSGEGVEALDALGFETETIPYGDSYTDIKGQLTTDEFYALTDGVVEFSQIINALTEITDTSIPFSKKPTSILIAFWSLVEGIRFEAISDVVDNLIQDKPNDYVYNYFYYLAEIWAKLCVIAAYEKNLNPEVAVYDLHQIQ
ncbi:MAG: hypothetical protein KUG68_12490 [Flavobacteriaceae bacterium]|nr:hypothetical protein [Flavobacteriaceae bacterium]